MLNSFFLKIYMYFAKSLSTDMLYLKNIHLAIKYKSDSRIVSWKVNSDLKLCLFFFPSQCKTTKKTCLKKGDRSSHSGLWIKHEASGRKLYIPNRTQIHLFTKTKIPRDKIYLKKTKIHGYITELKKTLHKTIFSFLCVFKQ